MEISATLVADPQQEVPLKEWDWEAVCSHQGVALIWHRGTSLIRKRPYLVPYSI